MGNEILHHERNSFTTAHIQLFTVMNRFTSLLRTCRLSSLNKPLAETPSYNLFKSYPLHQVIESTPASFHRRNWGLKCPIPYKQRSLYINVQALDSEVGLAQYEAGAGFYRKLQRFREFGVPLKLPKVDADGYFLLANNSNKSLRGMNPKQIKSLLDESKRKRKDFLTPLLKSAKSRDEVYKTSAKLDAKAEKYLGFEQSSIYGSRAVTNTNTSKATAIGLNYGLQGVAFNTPNGVVSKKQVKGRELGRIIAIGGFIAKRTSTPGDNDNRIDKNQKKYVVAKAEAHSNGQLGITIN